MAVLDSVSWGKSAVRGLYVRLGEGQEAVRRNFVADTPAEVVVALRRSSPVPRRGCCRENWVLPGRTVVAAADIDLDSSVAVVGCSSFVLRS